MADVVSPVSFDDPDNTCSRLRFPFRNRTLRFPRVADQGPALLLGLDHFGFVGIWVVVLSQGLLIDNLARRLLPLISGEDLDNHLIAMDGPVDVLTAKNQ